MILLALARVWSWLKSHPTPALVLAGLAALGLAFGAGRYSKPALVVTKTEAHEVVKYVDRVVTVEKKVADTKVHRVVVTKYVKEPSGEVTKETTTTTDRGSKIATNVDTTTTEAASAAVDTKSSTVVSNQPGWLVSAMAGASFAGGTHTVVGVQVQRRLVGPVWLGAFVLGQTDLKGGTVGGMLGVSF